MLSNNENTFKSTNAGLSVEYLIDGDIFTPMQKAAENVLNDFKTRVGVKGQFLNWVNLPKEQLKRVDMIYEIVDKIKSESGNRTLSVLGIGGSKHTLEHLLNLSNLEGHKNVKFYSDIDGLSYNSFKEEIGGDFLSSNYLVVSKSGTTFETKDAYLRTEKELIKAYVAKGNNEEKAQELANKHFIAVTDAGESSELRRNATAKKYIGEFFVHDDVGGRFSALDDHGLFTLAYAGMKKADMVILLESADKMTAIAFESDIQKNIPMQRAAFYVDSLKNGVEDFLQQLFGKHFECGTENWLKQLHFESLKDARLSVGKAPDSMHYAAEAHFDPRNKYNTTLTMFNAEGKEGFSNYNAYSKSISETYANCSPTSIEKLDIAERGITPEAIGSYCQLKHFETIFKGMLKREVDSIPQPAVLDEVLQPSVETYKKAFKGGLLNPGN